jgi:hypothetical protein
MRGLVLWLFANLIFRLNNFIETIGFLLSLALIAPGIPSLLAVNICRSSCSHY